MKRVVLIPSYEPTEKLLKLLDELLKNKFTIVLVNDGSSKKYDEIFNQVDKKVIYLSYKDNHGKGYALKTGLSYIKDNFPDSLVITMDSDGQHTVKDASNLLNIVENKDNTILLGKRLRSNKTPLRSRLGNGITRFVFRLTTGVDVYDTQTGLRAFKSDLIPFMLTIEGDRFDYEMNVLTHASKEKIKLEEEVIETIYEDNNKGSHFKTIRDSYLVYKEIIKFVSSSIMSFIVDYSLYVIFTLLSGNVILSNIGARVLSSLFNYSLNKKMVFKNKDKLTSSIFKYYLLAIFILTVNTSLLYLFVHVLFFNKFISKLIIEVILFIISYRVQKKYIF